MESPDGDFPTPIRSTRRPARVTAVIPAKNEAANIAWVLRRLPLSVDEIVLVDGRSVDATIAVARSIRPDVVVVQDDQPGKGSALRAGVGAATGDYVVMLDADGSMDPVEIDRFLEPLYAGFDLVKGSRFVMGGGTADMTPLRHFGNQVLLITSNSLYRTKHTDLCYGFAAFRRDAFQRLELTATGFEIEAELFLRAVRHRLLVTEVPSFESPRRFGNSNLNTFRDGWRVLKTIVRERVRRHAEPAALQAGVGVPRPIDAAYPGLVELASARTADHNPAPDSLVDLRPATGTDDGHEHRGARERRAADRRSSRVGAGASAEPAGVLD